MVDFGNLVNKAKDFASKNPDKVRDGLDKAEDAISSKTGGKYDSQIHSAGDKVEQQLGVDEQQAEKPAQDAQDSADQQGGDAKGDNN
ncbi:hypothetical protein GCM10011492_30360 [Flexivirga endophytica]|uniref:Antitoxin n=1 Tax=Flexivirga endophytica TaxID=1849103 RepID=A0A916WX64_9MICO|nr:antitoxin [Flexivirga endophytica]GGB37535.1 hypothetical protein GCM10011492_30360 [Flexivirga endophytica]GHB45065.1 hypothetical protein GCM10008112_12750 [Flexivirga endophytica]